MGTGGSWQLGAGEVEKYGSHGTLVFEVFSSASRRGYVAIDDVKLDSSEMCPVDGKFMLLKVLRVNNRHSCIQDHNFLA